MGIVIDRYGREFKTLRVSLLDKCNLGCMYCTSGEELLGKPSKPTDKQLSAADLLQIIAQLHQTLQLQTIRLTGGEPLLHKNLIGIVVGVKNLGITDIKLTTNGFLLEKLAQPLQAAGMRSINVSLDAIDEDVFFLMSKRNNVQRIINGIDAAIAAGLDVKLNAVIMKGINESQVIPLLQFAFSRNIPIRFLEVMAMGHLHSQPKKYLFTQAELLEIIGNHFAIQPNKRQTSATANYWVTDSGQVFGIIANESAPFCADCNRLRLDNEGNIFGCLSSNHPISLVGIHSNYQLQQSLQQAMLQKQSVHFVGSALSMLHIGG